jgi:hypothetical protein
MTEKALPFDHRPDPVLGAALRQALSADDHSAFVARVMSAPHAPQHPAHWDVLAAWARRWIAAAGVAGVAAGLLAGMVQMPRPIDLIESIGTPPARVLLATIAPPDPAVLLVPGDLP